MCRGFSIFQALKPPPTKASINRKSLGMNGWRECKILETVSLSQWVKLKSLAENNKENNNNKYPNSPSSSWGMMLRCSQSPSAKCEATCWQSIEQIKSQRIEADKPSRGKRWNRDGGWSSDCLTVWLTDWLMKRCAVSNCVQDNWKTSIRSRTCECCEPENEETSKNRIQQEPLDICFGGIQCSVYI